MHTLLRQEQLGHHSDTQKCRLFHTTVLAVWWNLCWSCYTGWKKWIKHCPCTLPLNESVATYTEAAALFSVWLPNCPSLATLPRRSFREQFPTVQPLLKTKFWEMNFMRISLSSACFVRLPVICLHSDPNRQLPSGREQSSSVGRGLSRMLSL